MQIPFNFKIIFILASSNSLIIDFIRSLILNYASVLQKSCKVVLDVQISNDES